MNEMAPDWRGQTYYGRAQLKAAPFNNWVVGGYVALAGMCGSSSILAAVADIVRPADAADTVRRGRLLPLLAPTVGAGLLVWDLHTPQRFYNMFRVAKATSPMSIGTWVLSGFSLSSIIAAGLQLLADRSGRSWPRRAALGANLPAAVLGAGMGTYTSALLAATSTPLFAAAPRALAVRFGSASVASGAAALALAERAGPTRGALQTVAVLALATELLGEGAQAAAYHRTGVAPAMRTGWGLTERVGATGFGVALPLALYGLSALRSGEGNLSRVASALVLGGTLLLRVSTLAAGAKSAEDPTISMRFAQPDNLPRLKRPRRAPPRLRAARRRNAAGPRPPSG